MASSPGESGAPAPASTAVNVTRRTPHRAGGHRATGKRSLRHLRWVDAVVSAGFSSGFPGRVPMTAPSAPEAPATPVRPVIMTVDDDPGVSRAVARDLRRKYGER